MGFNEFFYKRLLEVEQVCVNKRGCKAPFHLGGLGACYPPKI